ncbi:MAG: TonB-dependent receptor [Acidobacteria bacterium]|nr:TonB-dependent receptor [Acidobacteriota bacterium]MCB9398795.1 TonB-dependent receptor [Acidobacteriota bacterium]
MLRVMVSFCLLGIALFAQDEKKVTTLSLAEILNLEVVTASKTAEKISEAPATVYVFTHEMIVNAGYYSLDQLLEAVPEIELQNKAVAEYNNYYSIRGISGNDKFIVLLDGFRFNSPTGSPHVIATNYPLANAKRVEVILGPASALYGADAFGGVVNIITFDESDGAGGQVNASFGDFSTQTLDFNYSMRIQNLFFSAAASSYHSDEPNFSKEYPEDFAWYNNQFSNSGTVLLSPFVPIEVPVSADLANQPYANPIDSHFFNINLRGDHFHFGYATNREGHSSSGGMRPEYNLYVEDARFEVEVSSAFLKHQMEGTNGRFSLQSSIWRGTYEVRPRSQFINTFTGYASGYKYASAQTVKMEEQLLFAATEKIAMIFGLSYEEVQALPKTGDLPFAFDPDQSSASQGFYYLGTNTTDRFGNDLTQDQKFFDVRYNNLGSYLQVRWQASAKVNLTLGSRFDHNSRYGSTFNPRLGVVLVPNQDLKIKFLYGQSYLAPSPYVAYQHYGSFLTVDSDGNATSDPSQIEGLFGPFWHLPNPDLEPERLTAFESSLSWLPNESFNIYLGAYHNKVKDRVENVGAPNQAYLGIPVGFAESPANIGELTSYGGTLRLSYVSFIGLVYVNTFLAYSLTDGDLDGGALTYAAKNTVKFGADLYYNNWTLTPALLNRSASKHFLFDGQGQNFENDAFTVVDLHLKYDGLVQTEKLALSAFLKCENVFDKRYYNLSWGTEESFTSTPQDPRRISAGLRLKY